ncbi:MAG TPA: hypothetical protein VN540_08260 [Clostridia bacterium]|nr:hypothetical protein [Clostridia bacterium]
MKKLLAMLVVLLMAMAIVGCQPQEPANTEDQPVETTAAPVETQAPVETVAPTEAPVVTEAPPAEVTYVPFSLLFKNKTGVTISGLYLYPTGAAEKGNSICPATWIDKDNDPDESQYQVFAYIVRAQAATYDLYVEFADGTNATWPGLTIANYDKLSLKDGVDPATWEQEPCEAEDIALLDPVKAAGKTNDNSYPGYEILGLEIKNKTGKGITEFYLYETGADPKAYPSMIPNLINEDGSAVTVWDPGKGGLYVFNFFIRPHADTYEILVVYEDGTTMTIPDIDLFTLNGDGFASNEISMKDAVDPDLTEVKYDDGDPEPIQYIKDAIAAGIPVDLWYPAY